MLFAFAFRPAVVQSLWRIDDIAEARNEFPRPHVNASTLANRIAANFLGRKTTAKRPKHGNCTDAFRGKMRNF
ncbi:MAG TPA: hypothetical protein VIV09_14545 [Pseudolabrys sp.]